MSDSMDGWQTVMPTSQSGMERLSKPELEAYERRILKEWEVARGHWSGVGKHTSTTDFAEAKKIHSRFKAGNDLGHGAQGVVKKVAYTHNNRSVYLARKHIQTRRSSGRTIQMLREEAHVMEKLDHSHIVKLIGTYTTKPYELFILVWPVAICNLTCLLDDLDSLRTDNGDREDIVARLAELDLEDLSAFDRRSRPPPSLAARDKCPLNYLRRIMGCISQAVAYCHRANIRHLDMKPSNILLNPGRVYLADFGIARDVNEREHTFTFGIQGTRKWLAPEIWDPESEWSMKAADVYSLGLVFLNIAAVLHGGDLFEFDLVLEDLLPESRAAKLAHFQARLRERALVAQEIADDGAMTCSPKHTIGLTSRMLSSDPSRRPTADQVDAELTALGGVGQIYHYPCCKKSDRFVERLIDDQRLQHFNEKLRLQQENERITKRLAILEGREETYEKRIENERRHHAKQVHDLQKQLEDERRERRQSEQQKRHGEYQHGQARRPHRPSIPRPERNVKASPASASGLAIQNTRPQLHSGPLQSSLTPTSSPLLQQHATFATIAAQNRQASNPAATTQRRESIPVPASSPGLPGPRATPSPGYHPDAAGYPLRSRTSGSRLPVLVNPSTPTRTGTPHLNRDSSLTESTQLSTSSSTFSHLSIGTGETGPTPNGSPMAPTAAVMEGTLPAAKLRVMEDAAAAAAAAPAFAATSPSASAYAEDTVAPGAFTGVDKIPLSPVVSHATRSGPGSVVSSPRAGRAEPLHSPGGRAESPVRIPPMPTAKSWADIARKERRL